MAIEYLTLEQVLEIYEGIVSRFGKEKGLVDRANLESALLRCEGYGSRKEDDETLIWKAAILLERIVMGHPFVDGNKRTGWEVCRAFLRTNGWFLKADENEAIEFLIRIAEGKANRYSIRAWLAAHSKKLL